MIARLVLLSLVMATIFISAAGCNIANQTPLPPGTTTTTLPHFTVKVIYQLNAPSWGDVRFWPFKSVSVYDHSRRYLTGQALKQGTYEADFDLAENTYYISAEAIQIDYIPIDKIHVKEVRWDSLPATLESGDTTIYLNENFTSTLEYYENNTTGTREYLP